MQTLVQTITQLTGKVYQSSAIKHTYLPAAPPFSFMFKIGGTSGPLSATIELYGTNDPYSTVSTDDAAKQLLATVSLSGTAGTRVDVAADQYTFHQLSHFEFFFVKVTAISGTDATVSVFGA